MEKNQIDASKIKILICCHKPCELPKDDIFLPIQVGAAISDIDLGMQRDDQVNGQPCDNISAKNKSYCELTAMYWAWKNIKKIYPVLEYIGLNHYRRFFDFDHPNALRDLNIVNNESEALQYTINKEKLLSLLKKYDGIAANPQYYQYPLFIDYCICHISDDLRILRQVINEMYPDYSMSFNNVVMRGNTLAHYNMGVVRWDDFDAYCQWLFSILGECEKRINISNYNSVQKRIFGYMGERLWNVFFYHNKMKIKFLPILWYVNNQKQDSFLLFVIKYFREVFINFVFKMTNMNFDRGFIPNFKY